MHRVGYLLLVILFASGILLLALANSWLMPVIVSERWGSPSIATGTPTQGAGTPGWWVAIATKPAWPTETRDTNPGKTGEGGEDGIDFELQPSPTMPEPTWVFTEQPEK